MIQLKCRGKTFNTRENPIVSPTIGTIDETSETSETSDTSESMNQKNTQATKKNLL
jgi:hypothetical protein